MATPTRRTSSWTKVFSFYLNGDHRDLHSFPTRRSSDLRLQGIPGQVPAASDWPGGCRFHPRSEEHTSELQSHSDLVCRLLLEKKNKQLATLKAQAGASHQLLESGTLPSHNRPGRWSHLL